MHAHDARIGWKYYAGKCPRFPVSETLNRPIKHFSKSFCAPWFSFQTIFLAELEQFQGQWTTCQQLADPTHETCHKSIFIANASRSHCQEPTLQPRSDCEERFRNVAFLSMPVELRRI
jgi:hypothetical protein